MKIRVKKEEIVAAKTAEPQCNLFIFNGVVHMLYKEGTRTIDKTKKSFRTLTENDLNLIDISSTYKFLGQVALKEGLEIVNAPENTRAKLMDKYLKTKAQKVA